MKDLFFRILKIRVSKRTDQPVTKEQLKNILVPFVIFGFIILYCILFCLYWINR